MYHAKLSTVVNVFFLKNYLLDEILIKTTEQTSKAAQNKEGVEIPSPK